METVVPVYNRCRIRAGITMEVFLSLLPRHFTVRSPPPVGGRRFPGTFPPQTEMDQRMNTPPFRRVVLIGIGLLGGSIVLALRRRHPSVAVAAMRYRPETGLTHCDLATLYPADFTSIGDAIDGSGECVSEAEYVSETFATADLVIICTPVQTISEIVRRVAALGSPRMLVTDVGSTKRSIVTTIESEGPLPGGVRFIGSHPIAGSEKNGPEAATPTLLDNRIVAVTPTERSLADDVRRLETFWELLGARTLTLTPSAHDRILARTSHLPHLVAAVLSNCVSEKDFPLTGTGFRDTTRIAAGLPSLWVPIFQSNREPLLDAVTSFQIQLSMFREALESNDARRIEEFLTKARGNRHAVGSP